MSMMDINILANDSLKLIIYKNVSKIQINCTNLDLHCTNLVQFIWIFDTFLYIMSLRLSFAIYIIYIKDRSKRVRVFLYS